MEASHEITFLVILWLIMVAVIILSLLKDPDRSIGVLTVYLVQFTATYWFAPAIITIPSYVPTRDPYFTRLGFVISFIGLCFFLVGVLIARNWPRRTYMLPPNFKAINDQQKPVYSTAIAPVYFGIGLVSYFILGPILGQVPTVSAIVNNAAKLLFVGALLILCGDKKQTRIPIWLVLVSIFVWPLVTILTEGFLGFGLVALITTLICWFQASGRILRPKHYVLIFMIFYFLLSVTETYFYARRAIRDLVWGGTEAGVRISGVSDSFIQNFQLFGFGDAQRLWYIEGRLDLSNFTGIAADRLATGKIDYANGETLVQASLMLIPRFWWLGKTGKLGGSELVTQYTGITFSTNTTVTTGQVMEFYINYGIGGVIVGFTLLGILIATLDQAAARELQNKNSFRFALYFLPALGLLLVGESAAAIVATTGASIGTVLIINFLIKSVLDQIRAKSNPTSITQLQDASTVVEPGQRQ